MLADEAYDADKRVNERLLAEGKKVVIPPKSNRKTQRDYDKETSKPAISSRTSSANSNNSGPLQPAMTKQLD